MQPKINLLSEELVKRILDEAYQLMVSPGIKVQSPEARALLAEAGARVDEANEVAHIPESMANKALRSAPKQFYLYDRSGQPTVNYGGDAVHFDPGSSGVHVLDPDTLEHHPSYTKDLVKIIKVAEMLPQYAAQSTAVVCNEVPKEIGDLYRLYLVLKLFGEADRDRRFLDQDAADDDRHAGDLCRRPARRWPKSRKLSLTFALRRR